METPSLSRSNGLVRDTPLTRPNISSKRNFPEIFFRFTLFLSGIVVLLLISAILLTLILNALPSIKAFGLEFLSSSTWDPVSGKFGSLAFIVGTLLTSFLALIISIPFSLAISIFLGEYYKKGGLPSTLGSTIELLSGIPSIIYGFWGLLILAPIVRAMEMKLGIVPYGVGIFTASIILAIMIIPYSASLGRDVINLVPSELKEGAYALGATRFEVIKKIVVPYARSGIIAGFLLSLGRALGETMAVTMVIGNANFFTLNIFSPANTMASIIANEFTEATGKLYLSSLIEIGLVLFLITAVINFTGKWIINRLDIRGSKK
ncbi:MAG TPA: phosphate ABC transporter permease subunit PstC [candidate division WOR-3 bacterium]|uniref:Phosphate transport system permease protein n=1 Tax=candidate division WOR-3 bacterium TaxID=2052148 RepID=A0A7C5H9E5_UNCW3|nr:phosphate ABC transporter permease subunit PstC [candidate division WOR-3 bacterium]